MPLVRFGIRNEYGLGTTELYGAAEKKDDPKAVLDGVAVSGLVGVLRQLGDLAEFAAEIFHGLQEQVMATASRSHKVMVRVQQMEAALPPLEKVVFSQTEHIHFAYTAGTDWHPSRQLEQNHIVNSDLPPFIMDSYEECRDPPSLHLLDKFDSGGPGTCLKRYSDPSFFKRALDSSDLVNADKIRVEKKARRSKKNGVHQRNVGVLHAVITSQETGRMQFSSSNVSRKTSIERTFSTSRSEQGDGSSSFHSRRSDYIDCALEARSGMPHKEQDHHILTTSRLKMQSNATVGSISPHEQNEGAHYLLPHKEKRGANSACVTWDEKTELLKSTSQKSNNNADGQRRISELMPAISDQNELESESARLENADLDVIKYSNEDMLESLSDGNLSEEDENESETYMDALNTTASEIETDAEKQTDMEVELPCVDLNHNTDCGIGTLNEMTSQSLPLFDVEPCMTPGSQNLLNFPEAFVLPEPQQVTSMYSNSNLNTDTDLSEVTHLHDPPRVNGCETITSDPLSSGFKLLDSQNSLSEKIISSVCNPEGSLAEISGRSSIRLWTNGGLLGLEPSKPPDFTVLDSANQNLTPITNVDKHGLSSDNVTPKTIDGPIRKSGNLVMSSETTKNQQSKEENAKSLDTAIPNDVVQDQLVRSTRNSVPTIDPCEYSTSSHDKKDNSMSWENSLELSSSFSEAKLDKSEDSLCGNNFSNPHGHGVTDARIRNLGCNLSTVPDLSGSYREGNQETKASTSSMFLPGYRLLVNSFQKQVSLSHGDTPEPSGITKTDLNEHLRHGSPTNSISSSPPLEHMRISFYPVDDSETSKLKLKFHDNSEDVIFPSFQLLPQAVIPIKDIDFESDVDTFSRSSGYVSDEHLSELSELNSEQWACAKTPGSEDNEIYDALRRVSSAESISRSSEAEESTNDDIYPDGDIKSPDTKNVRSFHNGSLLDLPNEKDFSLPDKPMPPPPPPLPPQQWRVMKPHDNLVEEKQYCTSEAFTYQNSQEAPVFKMSEQFMTTPPRQPHIKETSTTPPVSEKQKLNGHKGANGAQNGTIMDEKEDFLHQIRLKSFSLKRTATARPAFTPAPITDMKVTAILQKANAIRQAFVGSDDEDNDNWSDG